MIDINKHKYFLVQILKDIYSDIELANCLGFKGGTALMFFYDLPRFSVDLDFNLIKEGKENLVSCQLDIVVYVLYLCQKNYDKVQNYIKQNRT